MKEIYRIIIEFKTIHPLRFWAAIFIVTTLIIIAIWRLSRKKKKLKVEHLENQRLSTTVIQEEESVNKKPAEQKENLTFAQPQAKIYSDTSVKNGLEISEPKPVYVKPAETKQESPAHNKDQTNKKHLIPYHILCGDYKQNYWLLYNTETKTILNNKFNDNEVQEYLFDFEKLKTTSSIIQEYGWEIVDDKIFFRNSEISGGCDYLVASDIYFIQKDFGIAEINGIIYDDESSSTFFFGYIDTNGKKYWEYNEIIETNKSLANSTTIKQSQPEELPKAKVETIKSKDEVLFVNYEFSRVRTTNLYPVFRFPKIGTVIRSYRLGNTKRRGFKEESFQKSIELQFGKNFTVLGNARLNTGKDTRPFEPDIALISKLNTANLRIDIEIDEPYAGITRQPTHCKGDDVNRDTYFIDRGWVVIRFSEYQVHLQENGCLRFIAEIIKSAIPKYEIPNQFVNQLSLQVEKLWDIVQAQKWEKIKYREQYLNHSFQPTPNEPETRERNFDEQEIKEEKLVKPTLIGKVDTRILIGYNGENTHSRDPRVEFCSEPHSYRIDNVPASSASTIIGKFFPEFDAAYWSRRKAIEKLQAASQDLSESNIQRTANFIAKEWKDKGDKAAQDGIFLHEQIENFYLHREYKRTEEFHLFEKFVNEHSTIKPYRTEWRVFDEHHHIAGTIDLISKNSNGYEMYDWKRSKKVIHPFNGEPIKNNQWQSGVGPLSDIDDTSYNRYCLQQSLYKYILEKNYGLKVSKMYLIVLYPEYENYFKIEVPYLKDKAEYILATL